MFCIIFHGKKGPTFAIFNYGMYIGDNPSKRQLPVYIFFQIGKERYIGIAKGIYLCSEIVQRMP